MGLVKGVAKTIVVFFNVFIGLLGIAFVVIGSLLAHTFKEYTNGEIIKVELIWGPVAGLLVLGLWLIITSLCGIFAVLGSNQGLAKSYLCLLLIIIIIQIGLAITFSVYKQPINKAIDDAIGSTINRAYATVNPDMSLQRSLDKLQKDLRCCGNNGANDYVNSTLTVNHPPDSCCVTFQSGCASSKDAKRAVFFQTGCKAAIERLIDRYLTAIIVTGSVFGVMEIIAIAYTIYIVRERGKEGLVRFV